MAGFVDNIIIMLMSMTAATYLLCAMVLWLGGWLSNERRYHSTKLQKYLSVTDFVTGIIIVMMVLLKGLEGGVSQHWYVILDWFCFIPYAMFYPESIVLRQQRLNWRNWAHAFGPMAIGLPVVLIWGETYPVVGMLASGAILVFLLLLYVYSLYRLRKWDRQMCEEFSDISHKQTAWFRRLTVPFMLLLLVWIPWYFYPEQVWIPIVFYLTSASLAVAMSSHALAHEEFVFEMVSDEVCVADVQMQSEADPLQPLWTKKLEKAMNEQHLYRQPGLTLSELAEEINVNRTYLSNYINQTLGCTFYDYIASCRIEEAKTLLLDSSLPLSEIAKMSGFASQTTFSRIFKNNVGSTPTEYRKNHSPS